MAKHDDLEDWKAAGKRCLTTALNRAEELARDATEFKSLESLIKTVGDVVGAGMFLDRGTRSGGAAREDNDDD